MNQTYVVTEGPSDVQILKRILPAQLVQQTTFVAGAGSYSAQSLAVTILAMRQRPVALVMDADTENQRQIQERRDLLRELLQQAAPEDRFEVFAAIPVLESVLLQDKTLMEQIAQRTFTESEWQTAQHDPKTFLTHVFGTSPSAIDIILGRLNDTDIRALQQHPLIQDLSAFLVAKA